MLQAIKLYIHQKLNEDGDVEQQCIKCGEWWYADEEFFHHHLSASSGLSPYCKACTSGIKAEAYKRTKELLNAESSTA